MKMIRIRNSSVSIITRPRAGRPVFGLEIFQFATASRPALRPTHPPIQWVRLLFPGVKRPEREADHSPPSSTKVKNAWSYTSTHPYVCMTWCLAKYRIRLHGAVLC